jgi:AcrR family transcriptional regulator
MVLFGTISQGENVPARDESALRERILKAAFSVFTRRGYAAASTLEIASSAQLSKRELYAVVGNKQQMLIACITERAERFKVALNMPLPTDRGALMKVLASFGALLLTEVSDPAVIAVFRLAIAESAHSPEVALALDSIAREASRTTLRRLFAHAQACDLLDGTVIELVGQFTGLLWSDLLLNLLLGIVARPTAQECAVRARKAAAALLELHPARGR